MRIRQTRKEREHRQDEAVDTAADQTAQSVTDAAEQMIDEIECCLAEVAQDDEQAAERAFNEMLRKLRDGRLTFEQALDEGDILKAQYAHTEYVQRQRCCTCGCPWRSEDEDW